MSAAEKQDRLNKERRLVRKALTELENAVVEFYDANKNTENWSDDIEIKVDQWANKVERLNSNLNGINDQFWSTIESSSDEGALEKEYKRCQEYSDKVDAIKVRLAAFRNRLPPRVTQPSSSENPLVEALNSWVQMQNKVLEKQMVKGETSDDEAAPSNGMKEVLDRVVALHEASASGATQLPTAKLRRFGGDQQDFLAFLDEFRRLVNDRAGLSNLQKHKILRDLLDGEAARTINGIPLTEGSYNTALSSLIQRYGCVETIVFGVFTKMLELPKIQKINDIAALRDLLILINNYVITLNILKLDKQFYSCFMYPVVLRAIPDALSIKFLGSVIDDGKSAIQDNDIADEGTPNSNPINLMYEAHKNLPDIFCSRFSDLISFITHETVSRERQRTLCPKDGKDGPREKKPGGGKQNLTYTKQQHQQNPAYIYKASTTHADGEKRQNQRQQHKASNEGCLFCAGKHESRKCNAEMSVEDRWQKMKRKNCCWKCFGRGHMAGDCSQANCSICKGNHNGLLCRGVKKTNTCTVTGSLGLLPTGHTRVKNVTSGNSVARFLLDSGSQRSFITSRLADALGVEPIGHEWLYVHVFGGSRPERPQQLPIVTINLMPCNGKSIEITAHVIPEITGDALPAPSAALRAKLEKFNLAEWENGPSQIDILLNAKESFLAMNGESERMGSSTILVGTSFGHVVITEPGERWGSTLVATAAAPNLDRFWSLEALGILPDELDQNTRNYEKVVQSFKDNIERLEDGRYQVKMNVKSNRSSLESNKGMAAQQLKALAKKLSTDPQLKEDYIREIRTFIDGDFAEPVPTGEVPRYVMPHFPVINRDRENYKVRPVFNASAAARGKLSLNDCIEDTPNLLPCPLKVLASFRRHRVAFSGDISKAYLMVRVHPSHRNLLCFFWFENEVELKGMKLYRMTSTSFGVKDSQFNTIAVIQDHVQLYADIFPAAAERLVNEIYMDDLLSGADTAAEAKLIWENVASILGDAGMTMKKFKSSSPELRHLYGGATDVDGVLLNPTGLTKVLGVSWDQNTDEFTFAAEGMIEFVNGAAPTMRTLMGACARLYDPQGLLAPYTMYLKLILQEAHRNKLRLDDELSSPLLKRWKQWCEGLGQLNKFKVPRGLNMGEQMEWLEIHGFCDASDKSYAAVVYLKTVSKAGEVSISLVASKAKLAPLKQLDSLTIPRKELMGALLVTRLVKKIKEYLNLSDHPTYFWSDSQVTLHWIHSGCPDKWGIFVKNRLVEILGQTKAVQWAHCPGKDNPADLPSRGVLMAKLNDTLLWCRGPQFIREKNAAYPVFKETAQPCYAIPEARVLQVVCTEPLLSPAKYSSLKTLVRVFAYVKRAIVRFKELRVKTTATIGPLMGVELLQAKQQLLRDTQKRCWGETISLLEQGGRPEDPEVSQFRPFIDDDGLVRVGGRLQFADELYEVRHPILLKDDPFTRLLIMEAHEGRVKHMKTEAVINELREKFWIVRMRQLVKTVIHHCAACLRDRAKFAGTDEAPLPASRVEMAFKPFKTTGLDYMGPFLIKAGRTHKKVWVALFTCAVVRAVHLEVVEDLTAGSCLEAIRRFAAMHGVPSLVVSDNALTFKKASLCLAALFKGLNSDEVQNYFGQTGLAWEFNVPRAPWWGGFFERMVGLTKTCLRKVMKNYKPSLLNFITTLHEIAAVINQRPLTRSPSDADEAKALTPAQFMSPQVPLTLPAGQLVSLGGKPDGLVKIWRQREGLLNAFWRRWRSEYMLVLRTGLRRKGEDGVALSVGDVVIMQQDGAPRAFWKLGRIEEILSSRDKVARSYKVHLGGGKYVNRAGKLLAKLL